MKRTICPSCQAENADGATACSGCGVDLKAPAAGQVGSEKCPFCGARNPVGARHCAGCKASIGIATISPRDSKVGEVPSHQKATVEKPKPQTLAPVVGGALIIVAGLMGLGGAMSVFVFAVDYEAGTGEALPPLFFLMVLYAGFTVSGGLCAMYRRYWPIAEISGILACAMGLLYGWVICFATLFLGFAGFLLVSISRAEFS